MPNRPIVLHGQSISEGSAIGRAEIRLEDPSIVPIYSLQTDEDVERELRELREALEAADAEIAADVEWAKGNLPESEAEIFVAQRAIVNDPSLVDWVTDHIRTERTNAAAAVRQRFDEFRAVLDASSSEIIRNRILDVTDAERIIHSHLLGKPRRRALDGGLFRLRTLPLQPDPHLGTGGPEGVVRHAEPVDRDRGPE